MSKKRTELHTQYAIIRKNIISNLELIRSLVQQADSLNSLVDALTEQDGIENSQIDKLKKQSKDLEDLIESLAKQTNELVDEYINFVNKVFE